MSIFHTFEKQNWRTEEGTRRGVEELERKFGSGFRFGGGVGEGGGEGEGGDGEGGGGGEGGDGGGGPLLVESNGEISERVGRFSFAIE
ncbi:hypothetical protein BDN72DRAFT_841851 [Pluteus cervinus]|uniref:Uncharacterized protein n=1 Tax=Pluteus cervinus TaxID=181527 RepID=A0ACD3ASU0_9AGAR|nr:hypothetical protein BDN72DRAFT_841851 [Pluteus cervinus]